MDVETRLLAAREAVRDAILDRNNAQLVVDIDMAQWRQMSFATENELDDFEDVIMVHRQEVRNKEHLIATAEAEVDAARAAVLAAICAVRNPAARGNAHIPLQNKALRGLIVRSSPDDLSEDDIDALNPIIHRCYVALGGDQETKLPNNFRTRFFKDMFIGGWCSLMQASEPPKLPSDRKQRACAVQMGTFINDCDPTPQKPETPAYRKAGAPCFCKIAKDQTRIKFDYVDAKGGFFKYTQHNQSGEYTNVAWMDTVERVHAKALVAHDRADVARFADFNRANFISMAQATLHHWYHVGIPYERVPNLNFEPHNPTRYGLYIFNLVREFQAESHQLLPTGDIPPGLGL